MPARLDSIMTVADIAALKALDMSDARVVSIRIVTTPSGDYNYAPAQYNFESGATYTERLPGIVADTGGVGRWIMQPTPYVLSAADPSGSADFPGILWINTTSGDRFYSKPDLSWASAAGGSGSTTTTTTGFAQPSVGSNVTINVGDSSSFPVGSYVFVATGGSYEVISIPGPTQLQLENLGLATNAIPSTAIASGVLVTFAGAPGENVAINALGTLTTGSDDVDWSFGATSVTIDGTVTLSFANILSGKREHTVLFVWTSGALPFSGVTWVDGTAPSTTGKTYRLEFFSFDGGTTVYGKFEQLGA